MRVSIPCMQCFNEHGGHTDPTLYALEVQDSGAYWVVCRFGHRTATVLQPQRFEMLSDVAANAIVDGYYREAVASFTSALERFHEFCIEAICLKRGVELEEFRGAWKLIARQSERQLGAFIALYLAETGHPPELLSDNWISLRNDVVHRGRIPTRDEALMYGQAVIDVAKPVLEYLRNKADAQLHILTMRHMQAMHRSAEGAARVATMSYVTPLSLIRTEPMTLEALIRGIRGRRSPLGWSHTEQLA